MCVVDQKEMRLGVVLQIAKADVLPVADKVDEAQCLVIKNLEESGRSAPVLNIGLALAVRGRQKDAGLGFDERLQVGSDPGLPGSDSSRRA